MKCGLIRASEVSDALAANHVVNAMKVSSTGACIGVSVLDGNTPYHEVIQALNATSTVYVEMIPDGNDSKVDVMSTAVETERSKVNTDAIYRSLVKAVIHHMNTVYGLSAPLGVSILLDEPVSGIAQKDYISISKRGTFYLIESVVTLKNGDILTLKATANEHGQLRITSEEVTSDFKPGILPMDVF